MGSKWFVRAFIAAVVGFIIFAAYDYYRAGFHTRPEMPKGAFSLSYKNGLRAIVVGVEDVRPERKYLGIPFQVSPWYEDAWSFCSSPTTDEQNELSSSVDVGPGSRLEAVCRIDVDTEEVLRGAIYSVPNL